MSKNQCTTCKHYKPVHATNPRGDCTLYPTWLDVPAAHYCGQWASTGEPQVLAALDIDWNEVPEGYDWVAQDEDGVVWAYEDKPDLGESQWRLIDIHSRLTPFNNHIPIHPNSAWYNTLTKRPVATSGT